MSVSIILVDNFACYLVSDKYIKIITNIDYVMLEFIKRIYSISMEEKFTKLYRSKFIPLTTKP